MNFRPKVISNQIPWMHADKIFKELVAQVCSGVKVN